MRKSILTASLVALCASQALLLPAPAHSEPATSRIAVLPPAKGAGSGLHVTLGLTPYAGDPDECGSSIDLEVNVGDQVNVCYTLVNDSADTLAFQSLSDSIDGPILRFAPIVLAPGQSHTHVRTIVAAGDTQRSANWTGYASIAKYTADDTVVPDFLDISATGTDVGFAPGDGFDNEIARYTTAFPLRFYGRTSSELCLSIDGLIQFDDTTCVDPGGDPAPGFSFNQDIPTTFGVEVPTFLAPYWNNFGDGPGRLYAQTLGTAPERRFILQWNDLEHYAISSSSATFQVVFEESSDTIRYEYATTAFGNAADDGAWATVGMQGDPAGLYTKYAYYEPVLRADSAIQWNYTPEVSASAQSNAVHLDAGIPSVAVGSASLSAVVGPGESITRPLTISNIGERDLHWSIGEAPGAATAHFPRSQRYVKAPSEQAVAFQQNHSPSGFGEVVHAAPGAPWIPRSVGGGALVPAYGNSTVAGFLGFDAADPTSTFTIINGDGANWIYALSFIGNDFTKLYAIVYDSWEFMPGTYGTIDVATGAFTPLGRITGATGWAWTGLTQDPLTGLVYAVNSNDGFGGRLYTIDLATGDATVVGDIDGPGVDSSRIIPGIAISPAGQMYGIDQFGQQLLAIDKTTGAARVIESFGLNIQYFQDLEFDQQDGTLYWSSMYVTSTNEIVGEMRALDPLTATSTPIGVFPPTGELPTTQVGTLAIAKPSIGCAAPGEVPWLSVTPASGTIAAGAAAQDAMVTFDSSGLASGLHQASLCVISDDPQKPVVAVQVTLAINDAPLYEQNTDATDWRAFNNSVVAPGEIANLSSEGADDFVVTAEEGWSVTGFNFSAYGNNGNATPSHINLRVHADNGAGRPGDEIVCLAPNLPALQLASPANQIGAWLPNACHLAPGTYWVVWSFANVDLTTPILGFWGQVAQTSNQPAVWRNPGGMLSGGCTAWSTFDQCPDQFDPQAHDFGFSVFGSEQVLDPCADTVFGDGFDGAAGCATQRGMRD